MSKLKHYKISVLHGTEGGRLLHNFNAKNASAALEQLSSEYGGCDLELIPIVEIVDVENQNFLIDLDRKEQLRANI